MTGKRKRAEPTSLVEAARRVAGDAVEDTAPLTGAERRVMDELHRELPRPSKEEIRREADKLLKSGR